MMAKLPSITHLKQGNSYPDPIATAKVQGTHFTDASKHCEYYDTPDSKPSANDVDNPRGYAPINKAAKPNTFTGK